MKKLSIAGVRVVLEFVALGIVIVVGLLAIWTLAFRQPVFGDQARPSRPGEETSPPAMSVSIKGAATKGARDAKVAIVEYTDFECPFCASFARQTLPELERVYLDSQKILLAVRHLPLEQIHANAFRAAEAAECAGRQDRFWEMHNLLFEKAQPLNEAGLLNRSDTVGLDRRRFEACLSNEMTARIREDLAMAQKLSITSTPTFLVGLMEGTELVRPTHRLSGSQPFTRFQAILDDLLATVATR